ncbi:MAG: lysine-2,3-aminomutase-like protein [Alphaproteobacteria bacterium]
MNHKPVLQDKKTSSPLSVKKRALRSAQDVRKAGLLTSEEDNGLSHLEEQYDIGISAHVHGLIKDPHDPVARQYVPSARELQIQKNEEADPIGDDIYCPVKGIVHRYPDRVLLKATNICAVYCRYCFRKEMIGSGSDHLSDDDLNQAIDYIQNHKQIWEVILTGGDPFILSARRLHRIIEALNQIDHVQVIRIHSRIPVADPQKITDTHLGVLKSSSKAIHTVIHVNHRQEISEQVENAILRLRQSGISVLSQSVLLKGVNDDPVVLETLFRKLVTLHVQPYYLHHLDHAKGTSHFRVSIEKGKEIMKSLQGRISGICLPRYMLDIPGGHGKIPIDDGYVHALGDNLYRLEDYQGCEHLYEEGTQCT